ncbi:MAG TPA: CBS domain-containing protein [Gemmataceae bacterium]|jgi:CBS domain-containing protein|nr:CBS domain-containing protein [Gemmataceae bacterium]
MSRPVLTLYAATAAEVMTRNPVSIAADATVHEAVVFLTERQISAAPVISDSGRPVGVVTEADILRHIREQAEHAEPAPDAKRELRLRTGEKLGDDEFEIDVPDVTRVQDIMNPVVYSVSETIQIDEVVRQLVSRRIHRVFVVDETGSLVGVITTLDLLSRLKA